MGRRRQRVPRLPRQLHVADPRPCPPGGRGGRQRRRSAGPRPSPPRPRSKSSWPRRSGPPAVGREAAVHELRHRVDDVRDPGGAGVHRARLIARFDGAYHGTHDTVLARTPRRPRRGRAASSSSCRGATRRRRARAGRPRAPVAAIIIEPVQGAGGVRPADPAFLRSLREMTSEIGAVLIFDEIIAFRIGPNGAQGVFGVTPDLTTLGKIVGGGYRWRRSAAGPRSWTSFDARRPGAIEPRRHVQRQPGRGGGGARDTAGADARPLRPPRADLGERLRRGSPTRSAVAGSTPGSTASPRCSRSSPDRR